MGRFDIYHTEKRLDKIKIKIQKNQKISENNKKDMIDFFEYCIATGLSLDRVRFYADRLYPLSQWILDFRAATREDLQKIVANNIERSHYADWTKHMFKVALKKLYKWIDGNDEVVPERLRWMKNPAPRNHKLPEELLTVEEINKMIEKAENPRDKAFISVLAESGCRVGEISGLKIKHVVFDEYGAQIIVTGKTGMRRVRLLQSFHYLSYWIESHKWKDNPEAPVWVSLSRKNTGKQIDYQTIRVQLGKIAKKAGIKKKTNPHSFRHARATQLAKLNLNESQMSAIMGWVGGSNMPQTYIHLSGRDTDDALLRAYGMKPKENEDNVQKCPKCLKNNQIMNKYCSYCGMVLNVSAAVEVDEKRAEFEEKIGKIIELLKDQESLEALLRRSGK